MRLKKIFVFLITLIMVTSMAAMGGVYAQNTDNSDNTDNQPKVQKSTLSYLQQVKFSPWAQFPVPSKNIQSEPPKLNVVEGTAKQAIVLNKDGSTDTFDLTANNQTASNSGSLGIARGYNDIPQPEIVDRPSDTEFDQRSIIGSDDRVQITGTTSYPWRANGYIRTDYPSGPASRCSASLIEPDVIITAAHCIYDNADGGWFSDLDFHPGQQNWGTRPFAEADWQTAVIYKRWADNEDSKYDLAIVELDRNIGHVVGWLGRMSRGSSHPVYQGILNMAGYPGDKSSGTMWWEANTGLGTAFGGHFIAHKLDSAGGQSGAPVWAYYPGSSACPGCRYVTSVHTYGDRDDRNFANRLTPAKYGHINSWMNRFFSAPKPSLGEAIESTHQQSSSKDKPDLVDDGQKWSSIAGGNGNDALVSQGEKVQIKHDIRNIGTANVSPLDGERQLSIDYRLSKDKELDDSDRQIGGTSPFTIEHGQLMPFRYMDVQRKLQIPEDTEKTTYNVCFELDSGNNIQEFDETNNRACLDEKITVTRQFDISTNSPVSPGNNATVSISASSVGGISIDDIPEGWNVVGSENDGGILAKNDPDNDGHNEGAGWAFPSSGDKNPSLTLSVPENENEGNYSLNASIQNGDKLTKQFTIEVSEISYDNDGDGDIDGNEVKNAIRDFLFNNRLSGNQVKNIIRTFLFGGR